jgi:homoserine kinase
LLSGSGEQVTPTFGSGAVHVRVPATSANVGPGFDALGLALSVFDDVTARVIDRGLAIEVDGEGVGVATDETHLVIRAMRAAFDRLGGQPGGIGLQCVNRIPHGRGLGSSAAAIVAGVLLARGLVVDGSDALPDAEVLGLACEVEGHPDNVAACLLGGMTIAWTDGGAHAVRLDLASNIMPIVFIPPFESSTKAARGELPDAVPHADAAFNAGRAALLIAALTGAEQALWAATEDRLHQGYRAPAMPQSADLVTRLRAAGVPAVVSGAGPTVLALARSAGEREAAVAAGPPEWRISAVQVAGAAAVTPITD